MLKQLIRIFAVYNSSGNKKYKLFVEPEWALSQ